jgi:hypothetical protein
MIIHLCKGDVKNSKFGLTSKGGTIKVQCVMSIRYLGEQFSFRIWELWP